MTTSSACLIVLLGTLLLATAHVRAEGSKTAEEPLSFADVFENLNSHFQNATAVVERVLNTDIPSTREEVKAALDSNLNGLKSTSEKIQKKLAEYNVTGTTFSDLLGQVQSQLNRTMEDLAHRSPDLAKLLEQAKTGYSSLVDVSKQVSEVVEDKASSVGGDLKALAETARDELSKAATQLEAKVQEVVAESKKKSKTS